MNGREEKIYGEEGGKEILVREEGKEINGSERGKEEGRN